MKCFSLAGRAALRVIALGAACLSLLASGVAHAECDLKLVNAGPCTADAEFGPPAVGEIYGLKITVAVSGTPKKPFRIRWEIANRTLYFDGIDVGPGSGYWWWMTQWMSLDGPIPWSVTLDPDNVTGDSDLSNNTMSGVFEPVPPESAIEKYAFRRMHGHLSYRAVFREGSGRIPLFSVLFGIPSSHGAQRIIRYELPDEGTLIRTAPNDLPVCEVLRIDAPAGTYEGTLRFEVETSNVRVNPTLLRKVTWQDLDQLNAQASGWTLPDQNCQSTSPQVSEFVENALPANYRESMMPYDAARTLHRAVAGRLAYLSPPPAGDAVGVLASGTADCGGFASLLVASLRHVGVPARRIGGFWQGTSQWHVRVEFHLPGHGWILTDPTHSNAQDPSGDYAYYFGQIDDADRFVSMDVGDAHARDYATFGCLQVPNWYWNGGAQFISYAATAYLQPIGNLTLTQEGESHHRLTLRDAPNEGMVLIEASSDLEHWETVHSEAAEGSDCSLLVPVHEVVQFYRARFIESK